MTPETLLIIIIHATLFSMVLSKVNERKNGVDQQNELEENSTDTSSQKCKIAATAKKIYQNMDSIEGKYYEIRHQYKLFVNKEEFDIKAMNKMIDKKGMPERFLTKYTAEDLIVPSGFSLSENCIIILTNSILFFHGMKLKDDTKFIINSLNNDALSMSLHANFSIHELLLGGKYNRVIINHNNHTELMHSTNYGEVEIVFKNVIYSVDARYRLIKDSFHVILVVSDLRCDKITMTNIDNDGVVQHIELSHNSVESLLDKMRTNLNNWLKIYFNDYFANNPLVDKKLISGLQQYDGERTITLNDDTDEILEVLRSNIGIISNNTANVPNYKFFSNLGVVLELSDGYVSGVSNIRRHSVASSRGDSAVRFVDVNVIFSNLKMIYKYKALTGTSTPEMTGVMVFTADNLEALMRFTVLKEPFTWDVNFDSFQRKEPATLTLSGPLMREAAHFQYIIQNQVMPLMNNMVEQIVKGIKLLFRCRNGNKKMCFSLNIPIDPCFLFGLSCNPCQNWAGNGGIKVLMFKFC